MRTNYFVCLILLYFNTTFIASAQSFSGTFKLVNRHSNLCLAIKGASTLSGAETTQWHCDESPDIAWELIHLGNSLYKIRNVRSQFYLGLKKPSQLNGEMVVQRTNHQGEPQELNWVVINAGSGYYKIQNLYSGLFLAVEHSSFEPGRTILQWANQGQQDILWRIEPSNNQGSSSNNTMNIRGGNISAVSLTTRTFNFPGGGIRNNNHPIGDFCCTGETVAVMDNSNACVGYIYFFGSRNPGYNAPGGMVTNDLEILLSAASEFGRPQAVRQKGSIYFPSEQIYVGAQMTTTIGRILYTARISDLKFEVINGQNTGRFYTNSLKVAVTAQAAY